MPTRRARERGHGEVGTAAVELTAAIPFLLLAVALAAQLAFAGHALWSAGVAARAGARAALVGRDAAPAARRALPPVLRRGSRVEADGAVSVRVAVPRVLPLPRFTVGARASLGGG